MTDTGVGMTEDVRARIFDAFFSTRPSGSGLGLPTTRKIIEGHGGIIEVQSELGKGSTFVVSLPRGPLGTVAVRLRPEAAACLLGERMQYFLDARIGLDDLFGTSRVSLLAEVLAEARTSAERFACMERFLAANLRERRVEPVVCRAAALLRQNPHLRVRYLAARLDVSGRHLSRSFEAMFGMRPKQFARVARIERVWSAWGQGESWADIAYATRFADQAHMIKDFSEIVRVPPAQLVRPPS